MVRGGYGAPVAASETHRLTSVPTGPAAPGGTISGPVGTAWATPDAPDFTQQLTRNLDDLIAHNNTLVNGRPPPPPYEFPGFPGVGDRTGAPGRIGAEIVAMHFGAALAADALAGGYEFFRGVQVVEELVPAVNGFAPMNTVLENGATVRFSRTATAIGDDADTLQNLARSRGAGGHDLIVHGTVVDGEAKFLVNGIPTHPNQIAEALFSNPEYLRGVTPVNLVTCHGACGLAQELRGILGVSVNARAGFVDIDPVTGVLRELWK